MQKFTQTKFDYNVFVFLNKHLIIKVYVNDLLIVEESQKVINYLKKALTSYFKKMDLGPVINYLRFCIIKNVTIDTIFFCQEIYIQKILEHFDMQNSKRTNTSIAKKNILVYADPSY